MIQTSPPFGTSVRDRHGEREQPLAGTSLAKLATIAFLGITAGVQMSDRGLQSILSPAIRLNFAVGDFAIGMLHGIAGILLSSALAVPLAKLGDRHSRKRVLLGLIAAWTTLTALSALAPNFALFFAARAVSGITEFAMIPIVYSLIPDLAGERWRVAGNLAFAALMALGASAGFYFGSDFLRGLTDLSLSSSMTMPAPWRLSMFLLGLMGLPLLLIGSITIDPPRGSVTTSDRNMPASLGEFVKARLRPSLLFVGTAAGLAIAVQAVTPMIALALVRRFSADLTGIGHALGVITLATSLGSLPLAGVVDRALRARWADRMRPAIMGAATTISIPCLIGLEAAGSASTALYCVGAFLLATCLANALIPTMLQDLVPVNLRARCFAAYSFLIACFCALGPLLSGAVSQSLLQDDLLLAIALTGVPMLCMTLVCSAMSLLDGVATTTGGT